ncbi:hypothetical protein RhiirA5_360034 [Rhizophagus irregularis]|uniref:Cytochrome P450 n=1 Tax=Rhizophagus irregularis TaxID=588596 RepID=A0A2I1EX71_9GLOM|nr:hypothetical protein RhiirA5_360034 [Rhizophagus irregularis]PKC59067.1 hypothetical protein RhiirA1_427229 [Rhizophagus irregularis]PKY26720.1 hypothetical protein RhiirB3_415455 [Rhizophagus irregularis]
MISTIISSFEISNTPSLLIISLIIYITHFYYRYFTRPNPLPAGERMIILCRPDLIENMNIPSTKSKYPIRLHNTEGFAEYGLDGVGVALNNDLKSWKYNRQFLVKQ